MLLRAAEDGNARMVKLLPSAGANTYIAADDGCTPSLMAATWNHSAYIELVIKARPAVLLW